MWPDSDCRPRIAVSDGNLEIRAAPGRNISLVSARAAPDGATLGFVLLDNTPINDLVCAAQHRAAPHNTEALQESSFSCVHKRFVLLFS